MKTTCSALIKITIYWVATLIIPSAFALVEAKTSHLVPEQLYHLPPVAMPELAAPGPYHVGVRTVTATNPNQLDIPTNNQIIPPLKRTDRALTLEVWYPAEVTPHDQQATYENETRGKRAFSIQGTAFRNANPKQGSAYALVVVSHGFPGYRTYMYYFGEHLASHGYVVAAIDHTGSTHVESNASDVPFHGFINSVVNRARDNQFVLEHFAADQHFLKGKVDANRAAVIGHSFGGFGTVNTIGGCYNFNADNLQSLGFPEKAAKQLPSLLNSCAGGKTGVDEVDSRWKAAMPISPWGAQYGFFNADDLAAMQVPTFLITGDQDDISGYEKGVKTLYDGMTQPDRYMLVYQNARHNVAGHPPLSVSRDPFEEYERYAEGAWNVEVINGINKHFATAFLDCYVKDIKDRCTYLDLPFESNQTTDASGQLRTPWKGFPNRLSLGMELHRPQ